MNMTQKIGEKIGRMIGSIVMTLVMSYLFDALGMQKDIAVSLAVIVVSLWNIEHAVERQTELLSVDYASDDERA